MNNRAKVIRDLIRAQKIRSQEELIDMLAQRGIRTTQATLSRDLRKMQIYKHRDESGESCYVLPEPSGPSQAALLSQNRAAESVLSLSLSGQMGVIKTLPGCASMVAAVIDGHPYTDLMGTIAGDDTLLLILKQQTSHLSFLAFLGSVIPGLEAKSIA